MTADFENFRPFLRRLAGIAAAETLSRFRTDIAVIDKGVLGGGSFDPVTAADREAERMLMQAIEEAFPDHAILGEEHGEKKGTAPWRWVIDPVDGTRAFVCGVPVWTTLIGLEENGTPRGGVISQPFTDEHWICPPGETTTYERGGVVVPARVSGEDNLANARIMVTDSRPGEYLDDAEAEVILDLTRSCRLCRQGLDAYGFGLLASGHFDLVVESALNWYDIAAVLPVIEGAGGVACTWTGTPITQEFERGRVILAASQALADAAVALLQDVPAP